jgi:E3 ubiquitin-protein ligase TM129
LVKCTGSLLISFKVLQLSLIILFIIVQLIYCISGYYLGMIIFNSDDHRNFLQPTTLSLWWNVYLLLSVFVLFAALVVAFWWSGDKWSNHPLAKQLQRLAPSDSTWRAISSSINIEFRRIDKFTTGPTPGRRVIVTDSWLIRTSAYRVDAARQTDAHLAVVGTDEHHLSPETTTGVQYLNLDVAGVNVRPFRIR